MAPPNPASTEIPNIQPENIPYQTRNAPQVRIEDGPVRNDPVRNPDTDLRLERSRRFCLNLLATCLVIISTLILCILFYLMLIQTEIFRIRALHSRKFYLDSHTYSKEILFLPTEYTEVYHLPKHIIPMHYKIQLLINTDDYHGDVIININISTEARHIHFHSFRLDINYKEIKLINKKNNVSLELIKHTYHNKSQVNTILFPKTLVPGRYDLHIKFTGIITDDNTDGFVGIRYTRNEPKNNPEVYVANSQVMGARRIFPCWDEAKFKATFSITVRHPKGTLAISATSVKRNVASKDGDWTFFSITPVMSTYLIALMIYDRHNFVSTFPSTTQLTRNVYIWGRKPMTDFKQLSFANNIITRIADGLNPTQWYLNNDAIESMLLESTSNYMDKLRQHNRITSMSIMHRLFSARDILYDEKVDPVVRKTEIAHHIAHKLAHLWVGNVVAPNRWSFSWVNEGFSALFALKMLEKKFPDMRLMDLFVVQAKHECLRMDTKSNLQPLNNKRVNKLSDINSFSIEYYIKAPIILRMLQYAITSDIFWLRYRMYLHNHHYQSATLHDLWNALKSITEPTLDYKIHNVIEAMKIWINNNNYPIINVKRDNSTDMMHLEIDKHTSQVKWNLPVSYISLSMLNSAIRNNISTIIQMKQIWLTSKRILFGFFDKYDWILVNIQQSGYYRVHYAEENWQNLARYLQTTDYDKIDVLNRAQIIDDAYHFMKKGKLRLEIFFNLTKYLGLLEKDYIAWYPMIKAVEDMSRYIPYPRNRLMKRHMVKLLLQLLNRIGYVVEKEDEHDFIKRLRQEAIRWACAFNNRMCKKMAGVELKHYIAYPLAYKSRADYKEWIFCKGLTLADTDTWNKLFVMWTSKPDNNTLKYFACSEDPKIIYKYLRPVSSEHAFAVIAHHHTNSFLSIVARHARKTNILNFILKNFEKIKPRQISTVEALTVIINYVYSNEQLKMIQKVTEKIAKENFWDIQIKIHNRLSQINII